MPRRSSAARKSGCASISRFELRVLLWDHCRLQAHERLAALESFHVEVDHGLERTLLVGLEGDHLRPPRDRPSRPGEEIRLLRLAQRDRDEAEAARPGRPDGADGPLDFLGRQGVEWVGLAPLWTRHRRPETSQLSAPPVPARMALDS